VLCSILRIWMKLLQIFAPSGLAKVIHFIICSLKVTYKNVKRSLTVLKYYKSTKKISPQKAVNIFTFISRCITVNTDIYRKSKRNKWIALLIVTLSKWRFAYKVVEDFRELFLPNAVYTAHQLKHCTKNLTNFANITYAHILEYKYRMHILNQLRLWAYLLSTQKLEIIYAMSTSCMRTKTHICEIRLCWRWLID